MEREVKIPENVEVKLEGDIVRVKKGEEEVEKKLKHPLIGLRKEEDKILIESKKESKGIESVAQTFQSKIRNAIKGVKEGFSYELKVVYRHFPMDVEVKEGRLEVSNFLGEKEERVAEILGGVDVEVEDQTIYVRGPDKEKAGQTAANIEEKIQAPSKRDRRVFQDGIYIVKKPSTDGRG